MVKENTLEYCEVVQVSDHIIMQIMTSTYTSCSKTRYWLLLLVTLVLNIFFIIYYMPTINEESICPTIYSFVNGTVNPDLHTDYVISTFILGTLYAVLSFWMLLEYFVVTWPHFVLPKFLYSLKKIFQKLQRYRLLSWTSKYVTLLKFSVICSYYYLELGYCQRSTGLIPV